MNAPNVEINQSEKSLRKSVFEIINAKIQYADYQLNDLMASIKKANQNPSRPNEKDRSWVNAQKDVFDIIENSSLYTTKLLYLRANLTDYNSQKVLQLLSSSMIKSLPLQQIKKVIR